MPSYAIVFGLLLTAVGAWGYLGAETKSITALIPAFVGVPLAILGVVGLVLQKVRKHAMHVAAGLALVGLLAAVGRIVGNVFTGKELFTFAGLIIVIMAILCGAFEFLCIRSFIEARRARRAAGN